MAITLINEAVVAGARQAKACEVLGLSPRTLQRWKKQGLIDQRTQRHHTPTNKLTAEERQRILAIANSEEFQSQSPKHIVPTLADRGEYVASESSFYRVLRDADMMHHRGKSAAPRQQEKPEGHKATGPNQVWSWDITYCATTIKGIFFYLYLVMDIYSRKIVGWAVHETQLSELSAELLETIYLVEGVQKGQVVLHSDNGSPMKGACMLATLQQLEIVPSFSRPSVSNDNAYSESLFKTLKYRPTYPAKPFEDLEALKAWVKMFVDWYNNHHKHSGIQYVTPNQRHNGEDEAILQQRSAVYQDAREQNPSRWSKGIRDWSHKKEVWLNPSGDAKNNEISPAKQAA
jgi:putative transposase